MADEARSTAADEAQEDAADDGPVSEAVMAHRNGERFLCRPSKTRLRVHNQGISLARLRAEWLDSLGLPEDHVEWD